MSTETKRSATHTPGPWRTSGGGEHIVAEGPKGTCWIANVFDTDEWNKRLPQTANARLIAAAPELLEACQHLLESYTDLCRRNGLDCENYGVVTTSRAAIAKAEGH